MNKIKLLIKTEFGIEAIAKRELKAMGYQVLNTENGRITIEAGVEDIAKTNINLRTAERVTILCKQFKAKTFEDLFQGTKAVQWKKYLVANGKFIVKGKSLKSKLHNVPSCQAIVKKAIIESLKETLNETYFPENGPEYVIEVALEKDVATITLDTSGAGLHKRGYRLVAGEAPLKETLCAGMLMLSYWNKDRLLVDPMCGSGTIVIEAAMLARNIAPGLDRKFAAEAWGVINKEIWASARKEAYSNIKHDVKLDIRATDFDERMIMLAKENAIEAGVEDDICFEVKDIKDLDFTDEYGVLITNPPYGERIGSDEDLLLIDEHLKRLFWSNKTWSFYILTADPTLEKVINKNADRKRKLYNGRIKVDYYQFYGPRPPRD
ncbi:class I SAM-dependent RNA methyltransferase [Clostridium sp. 'deep sea']|uniref:THUMP domain-containing class I SAM-dependent RNA methyltransferase n=1 Tax=Clostridium sp. 'deep sea' TaxID=2779445 RepID=UPI00189674CE|nr:class I SAM-dependent RNA methyltransferase [Clostridium sp. 'deep sea']QOR36519.1 class I SAM-dependent RNA methyltransferase [Clostridium sp. 'deep sea']